MNADPCGSESTTLLYTKPVLRIRIRDLVPFRLWIRIRDPVPFLPLGGDTGSGMRFFPDHGSRYPGSQTNIFERLVKSFW
jgi:hypothetical protein